MEKIKRNFGFGCMRLPMQGEEVDLAQTKQMVDAFLAQGFNYFDTAHGYIGGRSETALRTCLTSRYPRESYVLTDKLSGGFFETEADIRPFFARQLAACGVDYFDFYLMHAQGLTEGFDVGLEMSGNAAAFHQLISVMRSGGKVSLLGLGDGPISVDMNQIITNGLTLQGIYGRKMDNWHQMIYMVQGGLDLKPAITHRFHYTEFEKGFEAMHSGKSGKVILDWTTKK